MTDWCLAQAKPNADHIAKRNLERQGFRTFQPLERRTVAKGDRLVEQVRPFFPGYIFVSYPDSAAPWSLVDSTYGVTRLVRFGQRPSPVPPGVIAELQVACDETGIMGLCSQFAPGSNVEIAVGSFTEFVGELVALSPSQRGLVLLNFMGRQMKLSVPLTHLRAASGSSHRRA